jgi:hypothetical protein
MDNAMIENDREDQYGIGSAVTGADDDPDDLEDPVLSAISVGSVDPSALREAEEGYLEPSVQRHHWPPFREMQNWATTKQQTNSFSSLDDSELPLPRWLDEDQNSPTFAQEILQKGRWIQQFIPELHIALPMLPPSENISTTDTYAQEMLDASRDVVMLYQWYRVHTCVLLGHCKKNFAKQCWHCTKPVLGKLTIFLVIFLPSKTPLQHTLNKTIIRYPMGY